MTSKLDHYRDALLALGQERIADLTEASTARYALDDAYERALDYCLEQGAWNFAMRTMLLDPSASVVPDFGYAHAFEKPADWVRTYEIAENERFDPPLLDLRDEAGIWYADCDPLYVRMVSKDTAYGRDLSLWPESFANYAALYLARRAAKRITGAEPSSELLSDLKRAKSDALAKDALNEPPRFPPAGTWARSRNAGGLNRSRWNGQFR
jgi:hypothetical protein